MPSIPERTLPVGTVTFLFTDIERLDTTSFRAW